MDGKHINGFQELGRKEGKSIYKMAIEEHLWRWTVHIFIMVVDPWKKKNIYIYNQTALNQAHTHTYKTSEIWIS